MSLAVGSRVGPYEILSALGVGGMGEVYRARDARLGRDVAIKILADSFAHDADRIARFQREAQVLAALNHPHIAHIYGLEEAGSGLALVMELVDGETLADRIAQGPLPVDDALPIARQIADALETAHEQGIVHRDLKPANISITPDGTVKVLDFGLAKLTEAGGAGRAGGAASLSPTITSPALMTGVGVLLGTAAYMSPEQARGKVADKRSDVWAFGCVLFEMLAGRRAFPAEEVSDTLATVLMKEPDWSLLPAATPSSIRTLLRRSLEKDRKRRLPDIGSARLEVDEAMSAPSSPAMVPQAQQTLASAAQGQRLAWVAAALAVLAAVAIGARHLTERPPEPPPSVRLPVAPPPNDSYPINVGSGTSMALSPDGRKLVFEVVSQGGRPTLALRFLDRDDAQELPGTEDAQNPFWSPDSRFVGFFTADGKVKRIDVGGGPPQIVCDLPRSPRTSGTWNRDGVILLAANAGPLLQVPAGGGMPSPVTALDATRHEIAHLSPSFLPDGRHFLYTAWTSGSGSSTSASIFVGALGDSTKIEVGTSDSKALYGNGYLLYSRQGTLLAQRFDADRFVTTGDAAVVSDDIYSVPGASAFHVSARGELAFRTGQTTEQTQLTIVDRAGKQLATIGEPAEQTALALSPDGSRVALSVLDAGKQTRDLWIRDLKRKLSTRFTFNAGDDWTSAWSPDGSKLAFSGGRPSPLEVLQQPADGSGAEERLTSGPANQYVSSWSPDGRFILFYTGSAASPTSNDVWVLPTFGDRKPKPFLQGPFAEADGQFSPDGRWVAYRSNESGQTEVYVVPFPGPGGKWQVSSGGGFLPRWRADGKEIFYATPGNKGLVAVPIDASGAAVDIGAPTHLFDARLRTSVYRGFNTGQVYDVFPDGQRFLLDVAVDDRAAPPPIRVITNWTSTLH